MTLREMSGVRVNSNSNSRHFPRFIKSCCPNPDTNTVVTINKLPITNHRKITLTSLHCLPDDILYDILSRVPLSSLPSVSAVCRRWAHIVESDTFTLARQFHVRLYPTIYAFSFVNSTSVSTLRLFQDGEWNVSLNIHGDVSHARVTAIGRKVFIVNRFKSLVFDTWTGLVKTRPGPVLPRKRFAIAAVNGRVYVAGGSATASTVEEFDLDTNEWRVVSDAPRRRYGCIGVGLDGVFYVIGGLKIGGACDSRAITRADVEARGYASSMDLYDVAARGWLRGRAVPGGGCVVAACGVHGFLYVLASHAVELSFWRFNGTRKGSSKSNLGTGVFGEWCRMKGPPLPAQVRLGGSVKFVCVAVDEKVVLIQVTGSVDDLLRRSGRNIRGNNEGIVLVFDCVTQEWSRGPNLPGMVQKASCVCVDC